MERTAVAIESKPVWVDLASPDAKASAEFYTKVFGWNVEVNPDPQYGGYGLAKVNGKDAAGIGPKMAPEAPTAWSIYIGTDDIDGLAEQVKKAGGNVAMAPFDVGDQGRMAVFQDPSGAFISAWQGTQMGGFQTDAENAYGWAELNARGLDKTIPFYREVFGWTTKTTPLDDGQEYTEFQLNGTSVAGAVEMNPAVPAEVPSYWIPYFSVRDVDASHRKALDAGGREMVPPSDYPGGRFAILSDPQGASFGLLAARER
jgi:predicted enzyme related to lactoylglutathione lyase